MRRSNELRRAAKPRVAAVVALAVASFGLGLYALAASALPAPSISVGPAAPTNQTSASFTFTDSKSITRFECSLDGSSFTACGTARPSTKSYSGPLAAGSHTFQVRAVSGADTSAATSYPWTIDLSAPHVDSIARAGATPTNASTVQWTVTFNEPVTGVDVTDFALVRSGLGGTASITSVTGSDASYILTAGPGTGNGTIRVDLVDDDSIRDLATNRLGGTGAGNGSFQGQTYTIDTTPPPAPQLTQMPTDPAPSGDSTFAWTDAEDPNVTYQCSKENASWFTCSSPYSYTVVATNNGQHQFGVRAIDQAGNVSAATTYTWKVSQVGFTMTGSVGGLYLGEWNSIPVVITNPNNFKIYVNAVTVGVSVSPAGCPASTNIQFIQSPISASHTLMVPAAATVTLAAADQPQIRLQDLSSVNQDACKGKSFTLSYAGTATN